MSAEGQSRAWMLAVVVSTALLLAVAAGAAIGSLMAQRTSGIVPVVDSDRSATRLSSVVAQTAEAAAEEPEGPAGDPVAINSVGGANAETDDSEQPTADDDERDSSPTADNRTGERMEPRVDLTEMREKLSPEQYAVCFNAATEPAFTGKYWDHHEPGAYHCVACDTPLFASSHKFDSGTGWPSFSEAVDRGNIATNEDRSHGMLRTEVLCANCGAHLGHLFPDGPAPTGLRYCINSAALEFREEEAQQ